MALFGPGVREKDPHFIKAGRLKAQFKHRSCIFGNHAHVAEGCAFYAEQQATKPWDQAPEVELDEMRQNQLRALGYVIENQPRKRKDAPGDGDGEDAAAAQD